jgi:hypothetical protein
MLFDLILKRNLRFLICHSDLFQKQPVNFRISDDVT